MPRRHKFEIIADILKECQTPKNITRLMYAPNASNTYKRLKKLVNACVEKGLLSKKTVKEPNKKPVIVYTTTTKGIAFLKIVNNVLQTIKPLLEELQ